MHDSFLRSELEQAREHTDALFTLVSEETLYERPIADRHRLIFYLGHLDAFDWNQVARGALAAPSFHPDFDRLFEAGIDPPPGQAPQDQHPHLALAIEQFGSRRKQAVFVEAHGRGACAGGTTAGLPCGHEGCECRGGNAPR